MGEVDLDHFHGVRFYDSTQSLGRLVAAFIGGGFVAGQSALVIATPEHGAAIAAALESLSFSIDQLRGDGRLTVLDAHATLASLMINGGPDAVRFESVVGAAIHGCAAANPRGVRVYDEMSDLLSRGNLLAAAARVESLWSRLFTSHRCAVLCGHSVTDRLHMNWQQSLCASHTHVVADDGMPHAIRMDSEPVKSSTAPVPLL
jgi:hypothetical protein